MWSILIRSFPLPKFLSDPLHFLSNLFYSYNFLKLKNIEKLIFQEGYSAISTHVEQKINKFPSNEK